MKPVKVRKVRDEVRDEHELLQQEDFEWLADIQEALSPFWAARLEYLKGR